MQKIAWNLFIGFCCLSLSACGGGGGGSGAAAGGPAATTSTIAVAVATSSGVAAVGNTGTGTAVVGNTVKLNGTTSYDLQGKELTAFKWSLTARPPYSNATINNSTLSTASVSIDVAGDYVVQLSVTNSSGLSGTSSITVKGAANPKFGTSILTLFATTTGLNVACNTDEDRFVCNARLVTKIHTEKLGCVTCDATQADSICNFNGDYGSLGGPMSIWNTGTNQYGDPANKSSPWNSAMVNAEQGPIIRLMPILQSAFIDVLDGRAIAFTLNAENSWLAPHRPDPVNEPLLVDMLTAYKDAGPSASAKREAVCNKLSEAMQ